MSFQDQVNRMCVVNNIAPESQEKAPRQGETPIERAARMGKVHCRFCDKSFESLAEVRAHQKNGCEKRNAVISY